MNDPLPQPATLVPKSRRLLKTALLLLPLVGGCGVLIGLQAQKGWIAANKTNDR